MDPATVAEAIPFTAWEQAVFVALFVVLVMGLMLWFSKQQSNWQDFISKRDQQWQDWMKDTNDETASAMEKVSLALDKLSEKLDAHDEKVESRINGALAKVSARKGK